MAKIDRLHVRDLGPIVEATLKYHPVTLLLGKNETGKTNLLEALLVLYTGTRGDVPVGENAKLTRDGQKGWLIETTVDGQELKATRSSRPLQATCQSALGDPRAFTALFRANGFLSMKPDQRKATLADLTSKDTSGLLDRLRRMNAGGEILQFVEAGNMKRAHAIALEDRRKVDRDLAALKIRAETPVHDPEVHTKSGTRPVSTITLDQVTPALSRLLDAREEALQDAAEARREEARKAAAEKARDELAALDDSGQTWEGPDEVELANVGMKLEKVRGEVYQRTVEHGNESKADQALAELLKLGGECPTCGQDLKEAKKALVAARQRHAGTMDRLNREKAKLLPTVQGLEETRKALLERKQMVQRNAGLRARLDRDIEAYETERAPRKAGSVDADLLKADIARLTTIRDARIAYEREVALREEAKAKLEPLGEKREARRQVELAVDPSAMEDEANVLGKFGVFLEAASKALLGEASAVRLTPTYELMVQDRPAGLAADSVRLRAHVACSLALSALTGLGLCFVDGIEALDGANRQRLLVALKEFLDKGLIQTAFVAAVSDAPQAKAKLPWLAWVEVSKGTVTYL